MPVLIDAVARRIAASVGDLVEDPIKRSIGLQGGGLSRKWLGQRLHARLQDELMREDPDFRAEVPVHRLSKVDGWELEIRGRADGVVERDGRIDRVDEIKSLHFATELFAQPDRSRLERFRLQLRLYAYLLSRGTSHPHARLLLVDIASGGVRIEDVPWSADSVESWLRSTVHRLVAAETRRLEAMEHSRRLSRELVFPHPQPRPQQSDIMGAVETALEERRPLLLQAATGSGKTAAVLHPALRYAMATGRKLVWLTFTTSQQQIVVATLSEMGAGVRSLQLRAKAKMCAHTEMICHEACCPYAADYGLKLVRSSLLDTLGASAGALEPEQIFEAATAASLCPFEVSLDLLPSMHAIVCDANYVFDPGIGLESVLGGESLEKTVLIIDEAHNLVERSRRLYSPSLHEAVLEDAVRHLRSLGSDRTSGLETVLQELRLWLHDAAEPLFERPGPGESLVDLDRSSLSDLRLGLDSGVLDYVLFKRERELWLAEDPAMAAFSAVSRFASIADLEGEEMVTLARRHQDGLAELSLTCLDASRFVGPLLERAAGVVALSATLEPFTYYREMLGLSHANPELLALPSPFPRENRLLLAVPDVDTTYRRREADAEPTASWVSRLAAPGRNVLVLLPSYAYLRLLQDRLPDMDHRILIQEPGASERERRFILEALSEAGGHLLLAVMGGLYAEGVDYPGDMLSQVMVVSPGLPQVSNQRRLLQAFLEERYGRGFEYAFLVPGMTRVVQAAGRLIRSSTDRGVIVLLGRRFLTSPYRDLLPLDWTDGDAESLRVDDPVQAVLDFFAR